MGRRKRADPTQLAAVFPIASLPSRSSFPQPQRDRCGGFLPRSSELGPYSFLLINVPELRVIPLVAPDTRRSFTVFKYHLNQTRLRLLHRKPQQDQKQTSLGNTLHMKAALVPTL